MARGGKDRKRQVERKQDLEAQREAKRAKDVQGKSAGDLLREAKRAKDVQGKSAGNQLRAEKARTKRSGVRAAAEGGDAGSKAKLKAEAQRKAAARKAEAVLIAAEEAKQQMSFAAWCELGRNGGGDVGGRQYSKAQCYQARWEGECCDQALARDSQNSDVWFALSLSETGGGVVGGQQYTETQCAVQALEIDDQHADAWFSLGTLGGGLVVGWSLGSSTQTVSVTSNHSRLTTSRLMCGTTWVHAVAVLLVGGSTLEASVS
jgi:hypothetical protein